MPSDNPQEGFRTTPSQKADLKRAVAASGLSKAEFIRQAIATKAAEYGITMADDMPKHGMGRLKARAKSE